MISLPNSCGDCCAIPYFLNVLPKPIGATTHSTASKVPYQHQSRLFKVQTHHQRPTRSHAVAGIFSDLSTNTDNDSADWQKPRACTCMHVNLGPAVNHNQVTVCVDSSGNSSCDSRLILSHICVFWQSLVLRPG